MKKLLIIFATVSLIFPMGVFARQTQLLQKNLLQDATAYWNFNQGNSTDYFGNNNGSDTNMSYGASYGMFGEGASFNGSSSYIHFGSSIGLSGAATFTVSAWIKMASGVATTRQSIFGTDLGDYTDFMLVVGDTAHKASIEIIGGSPQTWYVATSNASIDDGLWHLVTATFVASGGTGNLKIYVDGVLSGSVTTGNGNVISKDNEANIGALGDGGSITHFFPGSIDDVAVFSGALTASEISHLYTSRSLDSGISR